LPKASGTEWFNQFCALADQRQMRIYILADAPGVAAEAARRVNQSWPKIQFCGTSDGYFHARPEADVLCEIEHASPDILFVEGALYCKSFGSAKIAKICPPQFIGR
jgi:N-acetylglucosaminyldiphosphoundecaprenol N-acetyl-beta-D-mannosaminyltransferase